MRELGEGRGGEGRGGKGREGEERGGEEEGKGGEERGGERRETATTSGVWGEWEEEGRRGDSNEWWEVSGRRRGGGEGETAIRVVCGVSGSRRGRERQQ